MQLSRWKELRAVLFISKVTFINVYMYLKIFHPIVRLGQNGKYWQVVDGGIACDSETAQGFYLELREPTKV